MRVKFDTLSMTSSMQRDLRGMREAAIMTLKEEKESKKKRSNLITCDWLVNLQKTFIFLFIRFVIFYHSLPTKEFKIEKMCNLRFLFFCMILIHTTVRSKYYKITFLPFQQAVYSTTKVKHGNILIPILKQFSIYFQVQHFDGTSSLRCTQ